MRQSLAREKLDELAAWLDEQLHRLSGKSELAGAIRYARSRWDALTRYIDDGRLELSNNAAENAIRPVTLGRKNWLFVVDVAGIEKELAKLARRWSRPKRARKHSGAM